MGKGMRNDGLVHGGCSRVSFPNDQLGYCKKHPLHARATTAVGV